MSVEARIISYEVRGHCSHLVIERDDPSQGWAVRHAESVSVLALHTDHDVAVDLATRYVTLYDQATELQLEAEALFPATSVTPAADEIPPAAAEADTPVPEAPPEAVEELEPVVVGNPRRSPKEGDVLTCEEAGHTEPLVISFPEGLLSYARHRAFLCDAHYGARA